jgi:glycine/D-amino acid oxidase-like deaminating enzyme
MPGSRYWADRTGSGRRRTYPAFRGHEYADVVVVGGGLTGCTIASVLAAGGMDVILVDAGRLATGSTEAGLGMILPSPDSSYEAVEKAAGRRVARAAWKEAQRSAREFATALRKLPNKSDVEPAPFVINARDSDDVAGLWKEQTVRKNAGLQAPWLTPQAAAAESGPASAGAIRLHDAASYDPVRAALAFASAATARRARVFERSAVRRTTFTRTDAKVVLDQGTISTKGVVMATNDPGTLASQLRRHVRRSTGYCVVTRPLTAPMRREAGQRRALMAEMSDDPRFLRWLPEDRVLFGGATSKLIGPRQRDKALAGRTAQLMYEFSVRYPVISGLPAAWGWDVPIVSTLDGLPWIGPHRNYPFHFFVLALGWHGDALSWLAARAALRHFKGESRKEDAVFGFARHG